MNKTIQRIIHTDDSIAPTLLRLTLGSVMFAHGAQKALGWFGGYGFEGTMGFFTGSMGLPTIIAFAVIATEFLASIALLTGAFGRLAALATAGIMVGAIATVHAPNGFFMNWFGNQAGEGYEYHLLVIGLSAGVALLGSGAYSVDRLLSSLLIKRQPVSNSAGLPAVA